ncbi:MAG TPA: hypothetical protein VFO65_00275 [Acidimicrobiales bacterium]|nr:hypothetical protein [Acidimicrobiales bacterium]
MSPLSRREFLLAGAGLAGLAVAGACGSDDGDDTVTARVSEPGDGATATTTAAAFSLVVASFTHVAGIDERLTLALLTAERSGPLPIEGAVEVTVDGRPVESTVHSDGTPLPYLLVRHRFAEAGPAVVAATYDGETGEAGVTVSDPAEVKVPYPGKPMISVPSPTTADALGVDPICTAEPACPLHDVSLDAALAEKRPLAVLFSTPARCQSRLCGPVLDTLLGQREAFADKVRFLHVEIYKARTGSALAPTVSAYNLAAEPVLFLAGADGVVRERIDNAFDRVEAKAALERLGG